MNINDIIENVELMELLNSSIEKTYYKYRLSFIIDKEDFRQEVYVFIIPRLKNFDVEKSTIKTYLPMLVMSSAKNCIQDANGQSKKYNKLEFNNNTISMEGEFKNSENDNMEFQELIGTNNDDIYSRLLINEILNINSLSKNQRMIILLMSKGYTITDVAQILKRTPSCINITFQRAKEKIVRKYAL